MRTDSHHSRHLGILRFTSTGKCFKGGREFVNNGRSKLRGGCRVIPSSRHRNGKSLVPIATSFRFPGRVSAVGLMLPKDLSYSDWKNVARTLQTIERSVMWWIGDWIRFGEQRWGEKYREAMEVTGYGYST